jgi:hypothetical protein
MLSFDYEGPWFSHESSQLTQHSLISTRLKTLIELIIVMPELFKPDPEAAIGNLSIQMATHYIFAKEPGFHPDVYKHGRDKFIKCKYVTEEGEVNGQHRIHGMLHLQIPDIGDTMRDLIQPTELLQSEIDKNFEKVKDCVAGFHIRRGTRAEDSVRFGYLPFASQEAVDAMIDEAIRLDAPVLVMSDSMLTKDYFLSKVPKAISLELPIGFTACEHSQKVKVDDEDHQLKMNSFVEWFILTKMPKVYMTSGGVYGLNMPVYNQEGITSTFGYSAALYGGKIPYYVFNDGFIFQPVKQEKLNNRYSWSDSFMTLKYITMKPDRDNIERAKKFLPMHPIILIRSECTEDYEGVKYAEDGDVRAVYVLRYDTPVEPGDEEMIRLWKRGEGELREGVTTL